MSSTISHLAPRTNPVTLYWIGAGALCIVLGAAAAEVEPLWIVGSILFLGWVSLCFVRFDWAISLFLLTMSIIPYGFAFTIGSLPWITPQRILLAVLFPAWLFDWLVVHPHKPRLRFAAMIGVLFAVFAASAFLSVDPLASLKNLASWVIEYFIFFWMVVDMLETRRLAPPRVIKLLVAAGIFASLWGLIEFFADFNLLALIPKGEQFGVFTQTTHARAGYVIMRAMFVNHITFGSFLLLLIPLAYFMYTRQKLRTRTRRMWLAVILLFGVTLGLTFSRGDYLGLMVAGFVLLPRRRILYVLALGSLLFLLLQPFVLPELTQLPRALANLDTGTDTSYGVLGTSFQGRVDLINFSIPYLFERPFFGSGLQTYNTYYLPLIRRLADNYLFQLLLEVGILGTLTVISFLGFLIAHVYRAYRREQRTDLRTPNLPLAVLAGCAGFIVVNFTSSGVLTFPQVGSVFLVTIALAVTRPRLNLSL